MLTKNPLNKNQRLVAASMYDHDARNSMNFIGGKIFVLPTVKPIDEAEKERLKIHYTHVDYVAKAIRDIVISDELKLYPTNPSSVGKTLDDLVRRYDRKVSVKSSLEFDMDYLANLPVRYVLLANLVSNALWATDGKGVINISVDEFAGEIPNPLYMAEGVPLAGRFIRYIVHDNGPGFLGDPSKYLRLGMTTKPGSKGFGLYLVSEILCGYLSNHLTISSKPGDTYILIYHPLIFA